MKLRLALVLTLLFAGTSPAEALLCKVFVDKENTPVIRQNKWTPQLQTLNGRIQLMLSILSRHPNFMTANQNYRRNILELFSHLPRLIEELGDALTPLTITPPEVASVRYKSNSMTYDEVALSKYRERNLEDLGELNLRSTWSIESHILLLRDRPDQLEKLFRLLPFLFDTTGYPIWNQSNLGTTIARIQAPPHVLENMFFDTFKNHLAPHTRKIIERLIRTDGLATENLAIFDRVYSELLEGDLSKTLRGETSNTQTERVLSIESLPALVALTRGCFGGDCSVQYVPFYPLLRGVQVHYIRKSSGIQKQPDGYILTVEGKVGKKTVPYILTVNGPTLSEADVRAAITLVLHTRSSQEAQPKPSYEVAFPDWKRNPELVNWDHSRNAMAHSGERTSVNVDLPAGWNVLDAFYNQRNNGSIENYYRLTAVFKAHLGIYDPGLEFLSPIERSTLSSPSYQIPTNIQALGHLQRALVGVQATQDLPNEASLNGILAAIRIAPGEFDVARVLAELSETRAITQGEFESLTQVFEFGLPDLLKYEYKTRAYSLAQLAINSPQFLTEIGYRENGKARRTLIEYFGRSTTRDLIQRLWEERDIPDTLLLNVLVKLDNLYEATSVEVYLGIYRNLKSFKIEQHTLDWLVTRLLEDTHSDATMGRTLRALSLTKDPIAMEFRDLLFQKAEETEKWRQQYPIIDAYLDILSPRSRLPWSFEEFVLTWLQDVFVSPRKKADFVITFLGQKNSPFDQLIELIPLIQRESFWGRIKERGPIKAYLDLATKHNLRTYFLEKVPLETLIYEKNELQRKDRTSVVVAVSATPEIDFLWFILGGATPFSKHLREQDQANITDDLIQIPHNSMGNSAKISMSPISHMTWWSAAWMANQKSILEGYEPVYNFSNVTLEYDARHSASKGMLKVSSGEEVTINPDANGYRLPTREEQRWFTRAETTSKYYNGDNLRRLNLVAHYGRYGHALPVAAAQLKPNPFGLFDTLGNINEWTQTTKDGSPLSGSMKVHISETSVTSTPTNFSMDSKRHWDASIPLSTLGVRYVRTIKP